MTFSLIKYFCSVSMKIILEKIYEST